MTDATDSAAVALPADTLEWQRAAPLSVLFFLGKAARRALQSGFQMVGSIVAVVAMFRANVWFGGAAVAVLLAALVAVAVLRYWHYRFALVADGLRIRQGVLKKTHLDVQFDRVQGVDVERSFVFRLLGLATVTFDTAGSAGREAQLPAVTDAYVAALRERIERSRPARHEAEADFEADAAGVEEAAEGGTRPLVQLGVGDMIRIGLTDRSVLAGLVGLPLAYQAYDVTFESLPDVAKSVAGLASEELVELGLWLALLLGFAALVVLLAALVLLTIASAFLRFYDYELVQDGSAFRSRGGLLTRRETAIERAKVQEMRLKQSILMRAMGSVRMRLLPATSGGAATGTTPAQAPQALNVPLMPLRRVPDLVRRVFGDEAERLAVGPTAAFTPVSPLYIRARLVAGGVVPALAAAVAGYPFFGHAAPLALLWLLPAGLLAWQAWRRRGYLHSNDVLASRSGLLGASVEAFLFRKAQGATIKRSPLQRRHGLATVTFHLASGDVAVPYIDHATACRLRDYVLYKVATSDRPWH